MSTQTIKKLKQQTKQSTTKSSNPANSPNKFIREY